MCEEGKLNDRDKRVIVALYSTFSNFGPLGKSKRVFYFRLEERTLETFESMSIFNLQVTQWKCLAAAVCVAIECLLEWQLFRCVQ